jgi:hypothetical protein
MTVYVYEKLKGIPMPPDGVDGMYAEIAINDVTASDFDPDKEDWPLDYLLKGPPPPE